MWAQNSISADLSIKMGPASLVHKGWNLAKASAEQQKTFSSATMTLHCLVWTKLQRRVQHTTPVRLLIKTVMMVLTQFHEVCVSSPNGVVFFQVLVLFLICYKWTFQIMQLTPVLLILAKEISVVDVTPQDLKIALQSHSASNCLQEKCWWESFLQVRNWQYQPVLQRRYFSNLGPYKSWVLWLQLPSLWASNSVAGS